MITTAETVMNALEAAKNRRIKGLEHDIDRLTEQIHTLKDRRIEVCNMINREKLRKVD